MNAETIRKLMFFTKPIGKKKDENGKLLVVKPSFLASLKRMLKYETNLSFQFTRQYILFNSYCSISTNTMR